MEVWVVEVDVWAVVAAAAVVVAVEDHHPGGQSIASLCQVRQTGSL